MGSWPHCRFLGFFPRFCDFSSKSFNFGNSAILNRERFFFILIVFFSTKIDQLEISIPGNLMNIWIFKISCGNAGCLRSPRKSTLFVIDIRVTTISRWIQSRSAYNVCHLLWSENRGLESKRRVTHIRSLVTFLTVHGPKIHVFSSHMLRTAYFLFLRCAAVKSMSQVRIFVQANVHITNPLDNGTVPITVVFQISVIHLCRYIFLETVSKQRNFFITYFFGCFLVVHHLKFELYWKNSGNQPNCLGH